MCKHSKELKLEIINFMKDFYTLPYGVKIKYNIDEAIIKCWLKRYEM